MQSTVQTTDPTTSLDLSAPGRLSATIDHRDYHTRLAVTGEFDIATVASLIDAASTALRRPGRMLVLDLGGVTFCGAAGVSALLTIYRRAASAGISLVLDRVPPSIRRVLDVVGASALLPTLNPEDAARALRPGSTTSAAVGAGPSATDVGSTAALGLVPAGDS
jgi:anti-anti-sigma factor